MCFKSIFFFEPLSAMLLNVTERPQLTVLEKWAIVVWRLLYDINATLSPTKDDILANEAFCEECNEFFIPTQQQKICFMCENELNSAAGNSSNASTNSSTFSSPSSSFNRNNNEPRLRIVRSSPRDERGSPGKSPRVSAQTRLFKHFTNNK